MSSKRLSPAASALRSSRLFSLPPPLPYVESRGAGIAASNQVSNTATGPYPTQQAITSPPSSLARGDWGLKRPLPLRSTTRSSTPSLKINAVDTREHITDFDSAGDMSRSLDKFQELGLPLTKMLKLENAGSQYARSVFEPELDHTDPEAPDYDPQTGRRVTRWKYEGPHLAGLSEDEFEGFLTTLTERKAEFLAFARERTSMKMHQDQKRRNRHSGTSSTSDGNIEAISGDQFDQILRELRTQGRHLILKTDLAELINAFLDLPGTLSSGGDLVDIMNQSLESAPPSHPSGGLSYLRTDAIMANHPVFGPQNTRNPQSARILQLGDSRYGDRQPERVALAGFVADSAGPRKQMISLNRRIKTYRLTAEDLNAAGEKRKELERDYVASTVGIAIKGGNKYWAEPKRASIDERGHIRLEIGNASAPSVGAKTMDPEGVQATSPGSLLHSMSSPRTSGASYKQMQAANALQSGIQGADNRRLRTKRYGLGKGMDSLDMGDEEELQATMRRLVQSSKKPES